MDRRERSRAQAAVLIWAIRGAAILLLGILMLLAAMRSDAKAGVGFEYARSSEKKVLAGEGVAFQFELSGTKPRNLDIQVVRKGAGVVGEIPATSLPAGTPLAVDWTGLGPMGEPATPGGYAFRVRTPGSGETVSLKGVRGKRVFKVRKASSSVFPVHGAYNYGDGGARFGAGRSGHSHQGQDVFASCGTPLVSPERGQVVVRAYQASAGNYVVVRLAASGQDAVFMHLQKPSWARVGTPLSPGQQIGQVGADRQRPGLPPPLRALDRTRLVQRRRSVRPARSAQGLGVVARRLSASCCSSSFSSCACSAWPCASSFSSSPSCTS